MTATLSVAVAVTVTLLATVALLVGAVTLTTGAMVSGVVVGVVVEPGPMILTLSRVNEPLPEIRWNKVTLVALTGGVKVLEKVCQTSALEGRFPKLRYCEAPVVRV